MPVFPVLTFLPLSATILAGAFAIVLLNRYVSSRRRPHELMWGIAFVLFAVGAACQVYADVDGAWSPLAARLYYLTGAILNVAFLGLGTMYLIFSRRVANAGLIVVLLLAVVSTAVLFSVPMDHAALRQEAGWKAVTTMSTTPRVLAFISNSIGTLLVVGGAIYSGLVFWRKRVMKSRMVGVFLLAGGTLFIALGGTITGATGLRNHDYLYITMAIGILIMFVGYLQTIRPETATQPARMEAESTQVAS